MAKTGLARAGVDRPADASIKQLTMGQWSTREMRRSARSSSKPKGRASRRVLLPPVGGWK